MISSILEKTSSTNKQFQAKLYLLKTLFKYEEIGYTNI